MNEHLEQKAQDMGYTDEQIEKAKAEAAAISAQIKAQRDALPVAPAELPTFGAEKGGALRAALLERGLDCDDIKVGAVIGAPFVAVNIAVRLKDGREARFVTREDEPVSTFVAKVLAAFDRN